MPGSELGGFGEGEGGGGLKIKNLAKSATHKPHPPKEAKTEQNPKAWKNY